MEELSLFDTGPNPSGARHTDPATSHAAAAMAPYQRDSQRHRLLAAYGGDAIGCGLTDEEAGKIAGVERVADTRRCSELRNAGMIEPNGETRPTSTGAEAMVCTITFAGKRMLGLILSPPPPPPTYPRPAVRNIEQDLDWTMR